MSYLEALNTNKQNANDSRYSEIIHYGAEPIFVSDERKGCDCCMMMGYCKCMNSLLLEQMDT
jgi:hypothetical protein